MATPTLPRRPSGTDSDIIRGSVHTRAIDVNTYTDIREDRGWDRRVKPTRRSSRGEEEGGGSTTNGGEPRDALLQVYRPNIPVEIGEFCLGRRGREIGARFKVSLFRAPRRVFFFFFFSSGVPLPPAINVVY